MGGAGFEDHFDRNAERYERARPPYPPALWRALRELGALTPGARALDIGAGTGQATAPLVEAGLAVTAVEPGPALAARLATRVPGATVVNARAEDIALDAGAFDLVTAATAVHWFDLEVLLPRLHAALVPGGLLVVWRNVYGDPEAEVTPFRRGIQAIVDRRQAPPRPGPGELEVDRWRERLTAGGLFLAERTVNLRWSIDLDSARVRDLFTTFSDWTPEEADEAAAVADRLGGTVTEHYATWLIALRRAELAD
ncbi:class I SAM-dependent methyltransferase [Leifsonia sp. F6_8S_P_1B]|uniref:Class I SAM-dependent methyltransferase n=1 Tax=Leifsonia williamsii TaxID=3035919 RepID=A0ABT8K716_9MICO|nr:class I SAM-dependent methyltransferase [Leifsonia williamsii]MDN4613224.1 class I SAM-dependent methyltransferase [Leifsonia williamsii]